MPGYDIYRITRCRERHAVEAENPAEAMRKHLKGESTLKDDEVLEGGGETVIERATERDVTTEALTVFDEDLQL